MANLVHKLIQSKIAGLLFVALQLMYSPVCGQTLTPLATSPQVYVGSGTIGDLSATGNNLKWYEAASGGDPLASATLLIDGATYYVSQTGIAGESTRTPVVVKKLGEATQIVCPGAMVSNLPIAPSEGATVRWFTTAIGGTPLSSNTTLTSGTYYVDQTLPLTIEKVGSGFGYPFGVAVQPDEKIVLTDVNDNVVERMNADGTGIVILCSGIDRPRGIAIQADGKIVVSEYFNNSLKRMNADGTGIETLSNDFRFPQGVAIDADGKFLVVNIGDNSIKRMNSDGTGIETVGGGFKGPRGIAIQSDGKIVVADSNDNTIKRMNADGTGIEILGRGFRRPAAVAVQEDGRIVIVDVGNNAIKRMNADGTGVEILGSGFNGPFNVAIQRDGKILVVDNDRLFLKRISDLNISNRVAVTVSMVEAPVGPESQSFCNTAKVSELVATGLSGSTIAWYAVPAGGAALDPNIVLTNGRTYYAAQTRGSCSGSGRLAVTVTITSPPAPTGNVEQTYCNSATISDLTATGTNSSVIKWYLTGTGGVALDETTALSNGRYYASQTQGLCESIGRLAVTVTINAPATPTITVTRDDAGSRILSSSVVTGNQWFKDGIAITGATSQTLSAETPGSYTVQASIGNCLGGMSEPYLIVLTAVDPPTSLLSVYPSPAQEYLTISGLPDATREVQVVSMTGVSMLMKVERHDSKHRLFVGDLPAGQYILSLRSESRVISSVRFAKE